MPDQFLKTLEDLLAHAQQRLDQCWKRLLRVREVQKEVQYVDTSLAAALPADTPLFRIFDRRKREHTDWWTENASGYAESNDCANLEYRAETIRRLLNELDPEFLRDAAVRQTQFYFAPGEVYRAKKKIFDLMRGAQRQLDILDQYMDVDVLDYVVALDADLPVRLLTANRKAAFPTLLRALQQTRSRVEARENASSHDRWIILDGSDIWHLGASINHAGQKAFMINRVLDTIEASRVLADFANWWATGTAI